jgi:hypothetical protein
MSVLFVQSLWNSSRLSRKESLARGIFSIYCPIHYHSLVAHLKLGDAAMSWVSYLIVGRSLVLHKRRLFMLLVLVVQVERALDFVTEALAVGRLAVAMTAMLLFVDVAGPTTLQMS